VCLYVYTFNEIRFPDIVQRGGDEQDAMKEGKSDENSRLGLGVGVRLGLWVGVRVRANG